MISNNNNSNIHITPPNTPEAPRGASPATVTNRFSNENLIPLGKDDTAQKTGQVFLGAIKIQEAKPANTLLKGSSSPASETSSNPSTRESSTRSSSPYYDLDHSEGSSAENMLSFRTPKDVSDLQKTNVDTLASEGKHLEAFEMAEKIPDPEVRLSTITKLVEEWPELNKTINQKPTSNSQRFLHALASNWFPKEKDLNLRDAAIKHMDLLTTSSLIACKIKDPKTKDKTIDTLVQHHADYTKDPTYEKLGELTTLAQKIQDPDLKFEAMFTIATAYLSKEDPIKAAEVLNLSSPKNPELQSNKTKALGFLKP